MVKTAELICGVCGDLFRNPHRLPCGHSFCRRPCLLPKPSSTQARCIHCNTQFHVSELERNCELDESVQNRQNQESRRVACYLCRGLHDHCSVCAHCHQELCDLCLKEHVNEDIQKLCEVREITQLAADTLEEFKSSRPGTDHTLAARLDTIVALLRSLHRLVDQRLSTATSLVEKDLQGKSEHPASSAPAITTNLWVPEWIKQDVGTSKQIAKDTTMPIQLQQEKKGKQKKQDQRGLQQHLDISRSRNAVELFVDGVRAKITALDLKTHFETFGEVLDVFVPRKHRGIGYIALLPTGDPSEILRKKLIIDGVKIYIRKCYSFDDGRKKLVTIKQDVGTSKLTAKNTTMSTHLQQAENEKQDQRDLQQHLDISRSRNAVEIFVDGVRAKITALDLKTHFATFGEVLDVFMPRNQGGVGYIALLPTGDPSEILRKKLIIDGVKINVRKCYSFDDGRKDLVKLKEETKLEIFDKSEKFLKLSVDGIRRQISAEDIRAHFANFGEVLNVKMFMNPVTNEQSGNCHIMLRPTSSCNQILLAEHLIRGYRINIVKVHACNELDISLVRFADVDNKQSVYSQPLISNVQLSPEKLELPILPEPIEQQKQPEQIPLKLFVDGVKKKLSPQDLEAHFSRFGKVLDITMFMNPTIMEHNGNGNITLRPTTDRSQILETEHIIRDIRINVMRA